MSFINTVIDIWKTYGGSFLYGLGITLIITLFSLLFSTILGLALGFVVGVLIYVSASHLLPEAREYEKKHSYLAFLAGIGLALFIMLSKQ